MISENHITVIENGVDAWNSWREENPHIKPLLRGEYLQNISGLRVNFRDTDLSNASIEGVELIEADLSNANLSHAELGGANLLRAKLVGANLQKTHFCTHHQSTISSLYEPESKNIIYEKYRPASLREANLSNADLSEANLCQVDLTDANLSGATLFRTNLRGTNLTKTNLSGAKLIEADISNAILYSVNLQDTTLANCRIHGISAWKLDLAKTVQTSLIITDKDEPEISVDNLEVAQFIYLLLHNKKIRDVIDTVANKAVLILGRFTPKRKLILDAIKEVLRNHNYVPILFDFERPSSRDTIETITTLAGLSKFIIADISEPKSTPLESHAIIPNLMIPFVPIIQEGENIFSMFTDLKMKYEWVLEPISYNNKEELLEYFEKCILERVENKFSEIREKKLSAQREPSRMREI